MRFLKIVATLVCGLTLAAQDKPAAAGSLTAEQILEKSIEATGGRKAIEKITSTMAKGTMEMPAQGMTATMEFYAKAPNKRLVITRIEGFGEIRQGFDGTRAWSQDPQQGLIDVSGAQLAETKRDSVFNGELKWKELYPKVELKGKEKVGEREAYVLEMTPAEGKPATRYVDAETFLLIRAVMTRTTPQGEMEIKSEFSDYREVDGVKLPFQIKQVLPMGEFNVKFAEFKSNVEIDDAKFAKPEK